MFTRANAWTLSQNRYFPLAWYTDLFAHTSNRNNLQNHRTPFCEQLPNYQQMYWQEYWHIDSGAQTASKSLLCFIRLILNPVCTRVCYRWKQLSLSVYRDASESSCSDCGLPCVCCRSPCWSSCDPCCKPNGSAIYPSWLHTVRHPSVASHSQPHGSLWLGWAVPPGP